MFVHVLAGLASAEFRVQGAGFRVQGSGSRVQGPGFRVQGPGSRVQGSGFRVQGPGSRVQGSGYLRLARGDVELHAALDVRQQPLFLVCATEIRI